MVALQLLSLPFYAPGFVTGNLFPHRISTSFGRGPGKAGLHRQRRQKLVPTLKYASFSELLSFGSITVIIFASISP